MDDYLSTALQLLDDGWWVVPIHPNEKRPVVKWSHIYDEGRFPTEDELVSWWGTFPNSYVGIITGALSGVLVVDCDNQEAEDYAKSVGLTNTPWVVNTKRGRHFYFKWPKDVEHIKTLTWSNADGIEWPRDTVKGLDRKAHKGVVLVPPTPNYKQAYSVGLDWDDVPEYPVKNYGTQIETNVVSFESFKFEKLDLSHVHTKLNIIDDTRAEVARLGRKLMAGVGDNRHQRLVSLAGFYAAEGKTKVECFELMKVYILEFFQDPYGVNEKEFIETINHAYNKESSKPKEEPVKLKPTKFKPLTTFDADRLADEAAKQKFFIDPIVPEGGTILQVYGYSGHGKSMFVRHLLYAAAAGQQRFGAFDLCKVPKVLYLDFENSRSNVSLFLNRAKRSFGDAKNNFMIWTPFIDENMMNLREKSGLINLEGWIEHNKPDIVVIDTIRTAWAGLQENSAEEWGNINKLSLSLRNAGITVVLVHHSNKPQDGGRSGREAGSSNQLTVLETQIKVTQVYMDKDTAEIKAGIYDGDVPTMPMTRLGSPPALRLNERLQVCMELRYGKVREWSDAHEAVMYLGLAEDTDAEIVRAISKPTAKQMAIRMASPWTDNDGVMRPPLSDTEIADKVGKPVSVVKVWTEPFRSSQIETSIANEATNL